MPSLCGSLQVACIASASAQAKQNWAAQKSFFAFRPHEKWGKNKKVKEARLGWGNIVNSTFDLISGQVPTR